MSELKDLTFGEIISKDDREIMPVDIPEWGGRGYLRTMSAEEALKFNEILSNPAQKNMAIIRLVAYCFCDKDGNRLFPDDRVHEVRKKSIKVFMRLQRLALKLNGFSDKEVSKAEAEQAAKVEAEEAKND